MSAAAPPGRAEDAPSRVLTGRMPDITPAQLVGVLGAVLAVAISFGVDISREQQEAILALAAAVAAILFAADAHVRTRRAQAEAVRYQADQHAAAVRHLADQHREVAKEALAKNQPPPPLVYPPPPAAGG
jgi:ABC-type nickel/cobalt efflux system permease component RcnA